MFPVETPTSERRTNRRRRGMTAVELLVAGGLATLMMSVLFGVIAGISRQQKSLRRMHPTRPHEQALKEQLHWDLANSDSIKTGPNHFTLVGYAGRDFTTGEPTWRPTVVTYHVVSDRFRSWLARTERQVDQLTTGNSRTELVCSNVTRISTERLPMEGEREDGTGGEPGRQRTDGREDGTVEPATVDGNAIPSAIRIALHRDDPHGSHGAGPIVHDMILARPPSVHRAEL